MGSPLATIRCHEGPVTALEFGADPSVIYSGGADGTVHRWEWDSRTETSDADQICAGEGNVTALSIDEHSRYLFSGTSDGRIDMMDIANGGRQAVSQHHSDLVSDIVSHPNENSFISGSYDGDIAIWGYPARTLRHVITNPHDALVTGVGIAPSSVHFATGSLLSPVYLWDVEDLEVTKMLGLGSKTVVELAFASASDSLVTVDFDGELCVYDVKQGSLVAQTQITEHGSYPMALNADGTKIAVGTEHSVQLYSVDSATLLDYYRIVDAGVFSVTFVPGTDTIAVGRGHGEILVLETASAGAEWPR